ncbi:MAG: NUDIX hydrolase [Bdellovibrionota bacterium]|nr:MAG: NUDIX hydrolase [Bdellovibrionota bacterium]
MDEERNPWTTLSSRVVYQNAWISVREDQVVRPDGNPGIYGVVSCRTAVGVIALPDDDHVLLVGQYRYPTKHYSWEIIEGGSDGSEDPLATAKRELREEAGYAAERWEPLGQECHLSNCHSSEVAVFFIARGLQHIGSEPEGTEVLALRSVPLVQAFHMVDRGEIKDAMSIIALYCLSRMLSPR